MAVSECVSHWTDFGCPVADNEPEIGVKQLGIIKERPSEACLYQLLNVSELLTETVDYCNYLLREARKVRRKRLGEGGREGGGLRVR